MLATNTTDGRDYSAFDELAPFGPVRREKFGRSGVDCLIHQPGTDPPANLPLWPMLKIIAQIPDHNSCLAPSATMSPAPGPSRTRIPGSHSSPFLDLHSGPKVHLKGLHPAINCNASTYPTRNTIRNSCSAGATQCNSNTAYRGDCRQTRGASEVSSVPEPIKY